MLVQIQYCHQIMQLKLAVLSNLFQVKCLQQECENYQNLKKLISTVSVDLENMAYLNRVQIVTADWIKSDMIFLQKHDFLWQNKYTDQAILLPNYVQIEWDKLDLNQKIDFVIQMINLVKDLHQLNWIHGDLKLAHFLYDLQNQRVVLIDFALASDLTQNLSQKNIIHATPAYMAPELFHGQAKQKSSDIYALGLILYEVFFGKKPFYAKTYQDWAVAHCQQAVDVLPSTLFENHEQWHYWQGLIDQMLMKRVAYRLQDLNLLDLKNAKS